MTPISNDDWEDILDDIRDQKAVLLIGPEIKTKQGKSLNQLLREDLYERIKEEVVFYYERDGFFLFKPHKKVRVGKRVNRFFNEIKLDETVLQQVVQIPFDLIISINPDTVISNAFYRYGVKHNFHYFQHGQKENEDSKIESPTKAKPLVYNLFGLKDQDESLVLDYDDVFKLLKSLLGTPGLPTKLQRKLQAARTYVFLGFQFDKWYAQLLLKLLQDDLYEKIISVGNELTDIESNQFVIRQFQIQFLGDQYDFFGELYKRCDAAKILRGVGADNLCAEAVAILKCVAIGEIDNALELLHNAAKGKDWENDVILLKSRWSNLQKNKDSMDSRDVHTEYAKITDSIIELTKNVCP
jgi:hypothetical protein